MTEDLLDQHLRTRGFTTGRPTQLQVTPDGARVLFCRAAGPEAASALWVLEVATGQERALLDPGSGPGEESVAERTRRERQRDHGRGVTRYTTDAAGRLAVAAPGGRLVTVDVDTGLRAEVDTPGEVVVPRPDPTGRRVAYVSAGSLHVVDLRTGADRVVAASDHADVAWGLPEHVAGESFHRLDGFWWSPDGTRLLVARVDDRPLPWVHLADPSRPDVAPRSMRYPFAGGPNAVVSLHLLDVDGGSSTEVGWDRERFEYVVRAHWDRHGILLAVQDRAQTATDLLAVEPDGSTRRLHAERTEIPMREPHGVPARLGNGDVVWLGDREGSRRLLVAGRPVTPEGLEVRRVIDADDASALLLASEEPTESHVHRWDAASGVVRLTDAPGVHDAVRGGGTTVVLSRSLDHEGLHLTLQADAGPAGGAAGPRSLAEAQPRPRVDLFPAGPRRVRTAVVLPREESVSAGPLPVLYAPYNGPGMQRVVHARDGFVLAQWFADQGFAVVVADGRGTPGRGPDWLNAIYGDRCGAVLDDQVSVLDDVVARYPQVDRTRVAIHGWSYGGFLAAAAVLRRPDVFHAAVAGAPVTDQRMYDTHWAERFLGHPAERPDSYDESSLLADAPRLERPLMLVHGLADDNVLPVHTFRLSEALTRAGRPHRVLALPGVTHALHASDLAGPVRRLEVAFLREALGLPAAPGAGGSSP